ncbi:unnamed protein product, partial [Hapterophycus canaliculatus]
IPIPAKFCFHFANAFEDPKKGEVVVDLVEASFLVLGNENEEKPVWDDVGEKRRAGPTS